MNEVLKKNKILIVDDIPGNIKVLADILVNDYQLILAISGQEAIEISLSQDISLILMDVVMPEMDGYEAFRRIKHHVNTKDISVIFITAKDSDADEIRGLELGAVDYIQKPFNPVIVKARVANHMLLQWHRHQLQQSKNQSKNQLENQVNERTKALQKTLNDLQITKEIAEKANQAKTEFISQMSHEFKTPLNAVLGFAQVLGMDSKQPLTPSQQESVQQILFSGKHLLSLINDILDLSTIETGKIQLNFENINLFKLVEECIAIIRQMTVKKEILLVVNKDNHFKPIIWADYTRMKQIVINLLSNAIKYNHTKGQIDVNIQLVKDNQLQLAVKDTGFGIKEDKHAFLFMPFNRLNYENSAILGAGIGLTITKNLIEAMNGTIGFSSEFGSGSSFWVTIPLSSDQLDFSMLNQKEETTNVTSSHKLSTVLYIENNPTSVVLMETILKEFYDIDLISVHTAEIGFELAAVNKPQFILMDLDLPGMNGLDVVKQLKASQKTQDIPVIALTADATKNDISPELIPGFDGYLTKPIKVHEVIDSFNSILMNNPVFYDST